MAMASGMNMSTARRTVMVRTTVRDLGVWRGSSPCADGPRPIPSRLIRDPCVVLAPDSFETRLERASVGFETEDGEARDDPGQPAVVVVSGAPPLRPPDRKL